MHQLIFRLFVIVSIMCESREHTTVDYDHHDYSHVSREQTTVDFDRGDYSQQTTAPHDYSAQSRVSRQQTTVYYDHGDYSRESKEQTTVDYDYNDYYYPDNYYYEEDSITYDDYSVLNGSGCAYIVFKTFV